MMIGVSRIVKVGEELLYENVTPQVAEKYADGMIWARDITSSYPEEGVRLPYHRYLDDPQRLAEIAVFPENPALCKYGSKHLSDDEAIGVLEQFLARVRLLKEIGDDTGELEHSGNLAAHGHRRSMDPPGSLSWPAESAEGSWGCRPH